MCPPLLMQSFVLINSPENVPVQSSNFGVAPPSSLPPPYSDWSSSLAAGTAAPIRDDPPRVLPRAALRPTINPLPAPIIASNQGSSLQGGQVVRRPRRKVSGDPALVSNTSHSSGEWEAMGDTRAPVLVRSTTKQPPDAAGPGGGKGKVSRIPIFARSSGDLSFDIFGATKSREGLPSATVSVPNVGTASAQRRRATEGKRKSLPVFVAVSSTSDASAEFRSYQVAERCTDRG